MAIFSQMKISGLVVLLCMGFFGTISIPVSAHEYNALDNTVSAVSDDMGIIMSSDIIWRYKIKNGYKYKRKYDTRKNAWIGDWILVGPI